MSHCAAGAQSGGCRVGVEVRLGGEVRGSQVGVHVARVGGAIVMEGVWALSGNGGSDVGLLAAMTSISVCYHVLLGLEERVKDDTVAFLFSFQLKIFAARTSSSHIVVSYI